MIELTLPPLRERLDDLPLLVDAILARLAGPGGARLGPGVLDALQGYAFPGNVRELENVLERALAFANDGVIEVGDLLLKGARLGDAAPCCRPQPRRPRRRRRRRSAPAPSPAREPPAPVPPAALPTGRRRAAQQPARLPEPGRARHHPARACAGPSCSRAAGRQPAGAARRRLPSNLPDYLSQVERDIILRALNQTQFNRTQAASLLGISVRQLRYQMQKLDIHAPEP